MEPTYSIAEIKQLVSSLDGSALFILEQVITDEKGLYSCFELRAAERFITVRYRQIAQNQVQACYLLSYN